MRKLRLKRRRFLPFIILLSLFLFFTVLFFYIALSPVYFELAESGCKSHTSSLVYKSILKLPESDFNGLTEIFEDNGKIRSISLNSGKANHLRSFVADNINSLFRNENYATYKVPLGNLFKLPLLSGRGPSINIRIVPMGNFEADILSEFSDAGINQTKHSVYIETKARVRLLSPFYGTEHTVVTKVPLAETVIVGDVPALYAK